MRHAGEISFAREEFDRIITRVFIDKKQVPVQRLPPRNHHSAAPKNGLAFKRVAASLGNKAVPMKSRCEVRFHAPITPPVEGENLCGEPAMVGVEAFIRT